MEAAGFVARGLSGFTSPGGESFREREESGGCARQGAGGYLQPLPPRLPPRLFHPESLFPEQPETGIHHPGIETGARLVFDGGQGLVQGKPAAV